MSDQIEIIGAHQHNLKNVRLSLPKHKLVVFTGVSGSGKSSMAFDTLYAEGQRRYVESLSSYARQFLGVMSKPEVEKIDGLSPAISIDQKTTSHNPRSTVGTITEIYDYLRLLFARVGHPHCANCGREISSQSVDQIVRGILAQLEQDSSAQPQRILIMSPLIREKKGEFSALFESLLKKGYQRLRIDGRFYQLPTDLSLIKTNKHSVDVVIDRLSVSAAEFKNEATAKSLKSRLTQSVEEALRVSDGLAMVTHVRDAGFSFPEQPEDTEDRLYSEKLACSFCGISLPELEPRLFSFNSPQGACPTCHGLGSLLKIDPEKILASSLSLSEGAIVPFARTLSTETWWSRTVKTIVEEQGYDFRKTSFQDFDEETQRILLHGSPKVYQVQGENRFGRQTTIEQQFEGFITNLERRYQETDSDFIRREIGQFMQQQRCPTCHGQRLSEEALSVLIDGKNISQICELPIGESHRWSLELKALSEKELTIAAPIMKEIQARLSFLVSVGLNYLSLSREASTLAGGEAQRIRLASQIGTGLTGVLYVLDEPTIGLHQRDNHQLISTLQNLKEIGNSVVVVEHDRDVMLAADYLVDFGPGAGKHGGSVVADGNPQDVMQNKDSLTGKYLRRRLEVHRPAIKPSGNINPAALEEAALPIARRSAITVEGAEYHNLKQVDVSFPLHTLTCISGVSGSGKSTLLYNILYAHLAKHLEKPIDERLGQVHSLMVPSQVKRVVLIDQSPIGKTPRSNPATYTKIFDLIREVFANNQDERVRGYTSGRFSFNVKGGRCESCQGDGQIKIEMQFLPDVYVTCDVCHGKRYNDETLEVMYKNKNIADVLKMTVDEAAEFFTSHSALKRKIELLQEVGLGYVELGQPAPTLSGGEAQRVKLSRELSTRTADHCIYLLDEPTTGLHFADVQKLLEVLSQLVAQNNTVIVIEHNLDIIKNADWIIDLGPEGGAGGGMIVATGTPQQIADAKDSHTGKYLQQELKDMKSVG
jgi:excinuclease ABC subunit A